MADRETRKQELTARRKAQILAAALEVFAQKGYAAATIPEIARKAELAPGTIYLYFPNKRELFIKVIESLLVSPLLNIFEKSPTNNFPSVFEAALENRLEFMGGDFSNKLMPLMSEILRDPELKSYFVQTLIQPLFKRMSQIFGAQIYSGLFREIDPELIVRLVGGMMIGINLIRSMEGESSPFSKLTREQTTREIRNFILHGVFKEGLSEF